MSHLNERKKILVNVMWFSKEDLLLSTLSVLAGTERLINQAGRGRLGEILIQPIPRQDRLCSQPVALGHWRYERIFLKPTCLLFRKRKTKGGPVSMDLWGIKTSSFFGGNNKATCLPQNDLKYILLGILHPCPTSFSLSLFTEII